VTIEPEALNGWFVVEVGVSAGFRPIKSLASPA
jgi:hypothetical protein